MAVHNLSAPTMIVGWTDIKETPPHEGKVCEFMDGRGVIVRDMYWKRATYLYEGKVYTPTLWREVRHV